MRAVLLGLSLLCACGNGDRGRIEEGRRRWVAERPTDYVITACYTGFVSGCVRASVSGADVIASLSSEAEGNPWGPPHEVVDGTSPVDEMFADAAKLDCLSQLEIDPERGFVRTYQLGSCGSEGGESYARSVTCFAADTTDMTICP